MFYEYCDLADKINQNRSSLETKSLHEHCTVLIELNGKQERLNL